MYLKISKFKASSLSEISFALSTVLCDFKKFQTFRQNLIVHFPCSYYIAAQVKLMKQKKVKTRMTPSKSRMAFRRTRNEKRQAEACFD
ncbi:hypothetical protein T4E_4103 [Trichinella pseudospiralis]|uniref:Uncharacterized protein n=1 Tax=Trichinella pseudospiralis TaxID=6337 RepID=A0A0V0XP65_TRIPS|nr:hypothetical protein T4E_4103 [Trichinella pseudospiralis]